MATGIPTGQGKASTSKTGQEQEIIPPTSAEFLHFLQTTSSDEKETPITGIILRFHLVPPSISFILVFIFYSSCVCKVVGRQKATSNDSIWSQINVLQ